MAKTGKLQRPKKPAPITNKDKADLRRILRKARAKRSYDAALKKFDAQNAKPNSVK